MQGTTGTLTQDFVATVVDVRKVWTHWVGYPLGSLLGTYVATFVGFRGTSTRIFPKLGTHDRLGPCKFFPLVVIRLHLAVVTMGLL